MSVAHPAPSTPSTPTPIEADVVVIGAGPTGLSAAIALGRSGVRTVVLDAKTGTSDHPRGHVENGRTMELLRLWGIEDAVRELGLPREFKKRIAFRTRMAGVDLGSIELREDCEWLMGPDGEGPAALSSTPQDRLEPKLLQAALSTGHVEVRFGVTVDDLTQDDDVVTVHAQDANGESHVVRAAYGIAADGPRSPIRERLGIATTGPGYLGTQLGVYFEADLSPWTAGREAALYWLYNPQVQGVIVALDGDRRWHLLFAYDDTKEHRSDFTVQRCEQIVRELVGADVEIGVRSVLPWRMRASVADRMRAGRVFLAGDAAHAMPPTGGMGMNTGIGDAHNLAWKIAAVLAGTADDALLDTYEAERRPVAVRNTDNSVANARTMAETGLAGIMTADPLGFALIEQEGGAELRARLGAAVPGQEGHFSFDGLSFGYAYESPAILPDGTPAQPSTVTRYVPSARPGARAPHVWLRDGDREVSTIDLSDGTWVVLTASPAWAEAARSATVEAPLATYLVGAEGPDADLLDPSGTWAELYGVGADGCVLVRPDGHVAYRTTTGPRGRDLAEILTGLLHPVPAPAGVSG